MSSFPLLRLPNQSIIQVIRSMEVRNLFGFSILSKTAKSLVKSARIKPIIFAMLASIGVELTIRICENLITIYFYRDNEDEGRVYTLGKPQFVRVSYHQRPPKPLEHWQNDSFELRDYISHCLEIFHYNSIDRLTVLNDDFDLDSLQKVFNGIELRKIEIHGATSIDYDHALIDKLKYTRGLRIYKDMFRDNIEWQNVLSQNLEHLMMASDVTINELLSSNCVELEITWSSLSVNDLNRFIKLWIKGSNPRLKYLYFMGQGVFNEDDVFKGIRYVKMAPKEVRTFPRIVNDKFKRNEEIKNGYHVTRSDGTKGTIHIDRTRIRMVV